MMRRVAVVVLLAAALPAVALAHLMPDGQGSTRLVGNRAYTLVSIQASLLRGCDDDGNGRISVSEISRHRADLLAQTRSRVRLYDGATPGRVIYEDLLVPHADSGVSESASLTLMRIDEWAAPVKELRLEVDVFTSAGPAAALTFRAVRGEATEVAVLRRSASKHRFFQPVTRTTDIRAVATVLLATFATVLAIAVGLHLLKRATRTSIAS